MRQLVTFWAVALTVLMGAIPVASADVRIAVINPKQIIAQAPQAKAMRQALKRRFGAQQQKLRSLQQEIATARKKFKKNASIMSASEKQKTQAKLDRLESQFQGKRQAFVNSVRKAKHKAFEKLDRRFNSVIREVAKRHHDDIVLSQGVAYATNKVNITDEVLDRLRHKANTH